MRKTVRNMRGMFTENSRSLLSARCRCKLARVVSVLQHVSSSVELQMLCEEFEALLQGRLL